MLDSGSHSAHMIPEVMLLTTKLLLLIDFFLVVEVAEKARNGKESAQNLWYRGMFRYMV